MKTNSKVSKRIISLVLTVLLVLSMVPMSVFSAFAEEVSELAEGLPELSATIDTGAEVALSDADGDGYYDISTAEELYAFSALVNGGNLSLNAELTADIVVNEGVMSAESTDARVWTPIGNDSNSYTGTFDGNNKTVSGLYFNNTDINDVGLFGYTGENGTVKNTGVINSYFNGYSCVGSVVSSNYGKITNCYNTGTVSGDGHIGGVVGYNEGTVTSCNNTGTVNGSYNGGGVVGRNYGTITNCYNTGTVSGKVWVGGVVGFNYATVTNCYNTGTVSGKEDVGGVVGDNDDGTITNCYYLDTAYAGGINGSDVDGSAEAKTAEQFNGGEVAYLLQGEQEELVWGQKIGTDELPTLGGDKVYAVTKCNGEVVSCNNTEGKILDHIDYENGFCTDCDVFEPATDENEDGVYEISNAGQLYWFADKVNNDNANFGSANAILTADIVVNEGVMTAESTDARAWTPIGNDSNQYTGTFDGNNKTVSGLYFNNDDTDYIGLFGYVGVNGAVNNTGVINSYFNGYYFVGGVVGLNAGAITNCYNTGTVSGDGHIGGVVGYNNEGTVTSCNNTGTVNGSYNDGGVVGRNYGTITNCYNTGFVSGVYEVGGVVGMNYGTITNCYNTGKVSGVEQTGGVVGYNYDSTITNCYNTGEVSGSSYYVGGVAGDNYYGTITNCYNTGEVSGVYYIGGVAGDSYYGTSTNCYYLDTAYTGGIGKEDSADADDLAGSAEAKTVEQFANGEVAYLLQGTQTEEIWGQKIGTDELPIIGGDKVYCGYVSCADDVAGYTNNSNVVAERPDHNFVNGSCTACGVNALFYAERTVDYDGDVSDESKYFMQLEDALRYAEKSTQNITTYYSECGTVKILCNYAIDESVTVTVPSNVTLDLNGFELTNNGTINFESIDGFKVSGGNYTGDGTVKIDEYDGIIFENTLYYFGGEYTPGSSDKRDLAQEKDRTYFTAGEGYAVYKNAEGAVLNLYNATINSNESAQSGAYTSAIYYSGNDSLTVNFYGENNIYSKAASDVVGINASFGLVLNGLGENPIININCENATALCYGISSPDITINSGIVNIVIDNSGESCIGIDGENITVANDAEINITTGDASRRSVGIYANSSIVNDGEINTSFGEADTSAGVMVTGANKISNKGTMNALVLQGIVTDDVINYDYYTSGNVVVNKGFSLFIEEGYNHAFTVAEGTSLLINEDASFDLSILSAEDISIMGEVIVDGGLSLPEGVSVLDIKDSLTSTTDGGTVHVGDNSYCFENGKLKCTSEECHLTADDSTNVANCKRKTVCDICGAEYGDIDEYNHIGELIPKFDWNNPYDGECYVSVELYCEDCGDYIDSGSGYATLKETVEAEDCMHPGSELYEVTFEYEGVTYTDTKSFTLKSDNHVGEFVNGFCTECGGYEPATLNDNGTPDDEWDDYYEISNAGQLYWFGEVAAANDNYSKAVLTDDIIVNEDLTAENLREWIAIGESSSMPYCGSFDGQGHFISGLYAKSELNYIGLFGAIGWGATISNLGIKDSCFEGNYYVGGIVGYNDFSYIKNCYAENVEIVAEGSGAAVVGYNYGEVSNSYSTSDSFVGNNSYGTITNCYYLAGEEIYDEDGLTFKTAEQFASGEVAYLLQSGVVGEEIWDDELGEYVQTEPEHIWGQKIGTDTYPVFGGDKVYQVENCIGDPVYSNANENGQHNFVNGFCTLCGGFEPATLNEDDVYEIGNAGQLYWFADNVNNDNANFGSADAILTADIVVNEGAMSAESEGARAWTPIDNYDNEYTGTFDGQNHTVSGLYFNNGDDTYYVGLFGCIGENGTVKNTGVINSYFNGKYYVGGVVGLNEGTITNCYNTGDVSGNNNVGGLVGYNLIGTIIDCYNEGDVSGADRVGGVVGYNTGGTTIGNCYNAGSVSGTYYVGGVVGYNDSGAIENCYNTGEVSGTYYIGGVVGDNYDGIITNCYNTGEVSGSGRGGVVGLRSNGTITNCYYLDTACTGGIYGEDVQGSAEAKTAEAFASGEVAYLLQGEQSEEIWGQKIGTDTYPVLGGDKVYYGYASCADDVAGYTNNSNVVAERPDHNFVNGFCTLCGGFEPATLNEDGVYEIGNAGQLYWFAEYVNAGNVSANAILTADIVVNEGTITSESTDARAWTPMGNNSNKYTGTFDGNNKTVSGLYFNNTDTKYVGLFGYIGENGTVKNTGVINSYFNGLWFVGGVVGVNYGTITNSYNAGSVSGTDYVGGLVGSNARGTTANCYNTGVVSGEYFVGGVVGYIVNGTIENCYNTGVVSGSYQVGGVVGLRTDGTITNCYYLDSAFTGGIGGKDVEGSAEARTAEQFKSGEVAYLLGDAFGQKIGTDELPTLGGDKVYQVENCIGDPVYSNANENIDHNFVNGFCKVCDAFEPATLNEDGVYEIGNAGQLYWFADKVNNDNANFGSANAILTANIVVNEGVMTAESEGARAWTPIGNWRNSYTGTFDGNNYTVSGLYFNNTDINDVGLFGYIGENGAVKNTGVINSYFNGKFYVGGVVGSNNGKITNCYNTGDVSATEEVGGVVGYHISGTIENCYNSGSVSGSKEVGGVVGDIYSATISNCYNTGSVSGTGRYTGGVAGSISDGTISDCYNTGTVSGADTVGGVVGYNPVGTISDCYNEGSVSGTDYVGGVVGPNNATVTNCYNTGTVSGNEDVGGVAASNYGTIANCYNTGDVSGSNEVGGVVGYNHETIINCYNVGVVSGNDHVGGVVGSGSYSQITNCFYLDTTCNGGFRGRDVAGSAEAKTAEQFKGGEVAYLLQGEQEELVWGQKIGTDELPTLGGDKVYAVTKCNGEVVSCNNTEGEILDHNFEDGFCTVCGDMDGIAQVKGYSIGLGGNIAVNYYMVLSDEVLADENAEMVFTVPDTGSTYEVRIPVSSVTPDANGYYMFTCEVAAKEMASKIAAQIVISNNESDVFEYSVKQYAEYIINNPDEYANEQELVKAMLNYGANAQLYFDYNTDILANATLDAADKALVDNLDLSEYNVSVTGSEDGVVFYGGALSLKSETAIKLYFVIEEGTAIPQVSVNGKAYELTKNGSFYELKISDIPAHILSEMYEVKVGGLTISYGAYSYGYQAMNTGKEELVNTIKALYAYNQKALEYLG